jgi:hypothetical protein
MVLVGLLTVLTGVRQTMTHLLLLVLTALLGLANAGVAQHQQHQQQQQPVIPNSRRKVYVHLEGNRRKCFLEEMSTGTVLMSTHIVSIY